MLKTYITSTACVVVLLLACVTESRFISEDEDRVKRQAADVKMAHYLALLELADRLTPGCLEIGCGLIDLERLYKRTWSDQRIAELKARIALQRRPDSLIGHGQFDPDRLYVKRTSSDQRIAELMALIALSRGGGSIGHGRIDPSLIGRKKRETSDLPNIQGLNKLRLLSSLLNGADDRS